MQGSKNAQLTIAYFFAGFGCLGDGGIPTHSSFWRHSQHSDSRKLGGILPTSLQLFWRGPLASVPQHGHREARWEGPAEGSEMDSRGRRSLCLRQAFLLQRHIRWCLDRDWARFMSCWCFCAAVCKILKKQSLWI